ASVAALTERGEAGRRRRRAAARRAARVPARRERGAGRADDLVVGRPAVAVLGRVRLADHDRTCALEALDLDGVAGRDVVLRHDRARRVADAALLGARVLHRDGYAVQRAERLAARDGVLGGAGALARVVDEDGHECIHRRLELLDTREARVDDVD